MWTPWGSDVEWFENKHLWNKLSKKIEWRSTLAALDDFRSQPCGTEARKQPREMREEVGPALVGSCKSETGGSCMGTRQNEAARLV